MKRSVRFLTTIEVSPVGLGVFANEDIEEGEVILEFTGELVGADDERNHNDEQVYLLQVDDSVFLLPDAPGRFVNHSCVPNAGLVDNTRLVALRPMASGEEILFDYSTTMEDDPWTMLCACGEPDCRGIVDTFSTLPRELRASYLAKGIVQDFIARRWTGRAYSEVPARVRAAARRR